MQTTSDAALALHLAERAMAGPVAFIAHGEARLERLARACAGFCPVELLTFPAWDVLPYDRTAPSAAIVGHRVHTLAALAAGPKPRLVLTSAEAAMQRVPPARAWVHAEWRMSAGDTAAAASLRHELGLRGYHHCETVVDPGEVALRGHVVDIFPAGAEQPVRLSLDGDRVIALHRFDPVSQRSLDAIDSVLLAPAVEFPLDPAEIDHVLDADATPAVLPSGRLVPLFDYLHGHTLLIDDDLEEVWTELRDQADDAYEANRRLLRVSADPRSALPRPDRLFLSLDEIRQATEGAETPAAEGEPEPPPRTVAELIRRTAESDRPVIIAAPTDPAKLARSLARRGLAARTADDWRDALANAAEGPSCLAMDLGSGFRTETMRVLDATPLMRPAGGHATLTYGDGAPRIGDVVVHVDHGAARLTGLAEVNAEGFIEERLQLEFAGGDELLCHISELDRIWRYGSEGALDRLGGEGWSVRRAQIGAEIGETADQLAARSAERAARSAPAMTPDRADYERLARRFRFTPSPDQQAAIDDVLADLRRGGPPMDRLLCGDVGFGKTEVALRAAAAVALAGWQVAVVAPTTVLARQHLETFRRRFEGTSIRVEGLLQPAASPQGRAVRAGLADGSVHIAVGTQSAATARYARLGLAIVDEEQRLGEALKESLSATHRLVMTATPIPRTMQGALVGLQEVSVIATPPRRRQPTRTFVLPFDPVIVQEALRREHSRGGQSFVVAPRIADLAPLAAILAELVPDLRVAQAHGKMRPEDLETAVVGFAGGAGDVLLATNIIEAGLDIPRANTIVVMHADRFGLAQLHQIRGRVGRGGRRGSAFLMTEPGRRLAPATLARLHALAAQSHLGAGVAISAADLDQRGAGELFGDRQAGHVSALGTELYQHLLLSAVRARHGEPVPGAPPELHVGLTGRIPADMVPEPDLRLSLYRRLARFSTAAEVDAFEDELHDRFGAPPQPVVDLLALVRLRCLCAAAGVNRLDSGVRAAAFRPHTVHGLPALQDRIGGRLAADRVIVPAQGHGPAERVAALIGLLETTA